jgi:hypothetical protein
MSVLAGSNAVAILFRKPRAGAPLGRRAPVFAGGRRRAAAEPV